ncbi:MAG: NAD(P)H-hydrate dehydratase, partial [Vulcanimicrobiota bacterium]
NNGGDGFCMARILRGWGYPVKIVFVGSQEKLKDDALLNFKLAENHHIEIIKITDTNDFQNLENELLNSDWIIDALFGTGLAGEVRGVAADLMEFVSGFGLKCLAVDIPSGVNSNNGKVSGNVIPADITVTFGLPKKGHFIYPGAQYVGELFVADIGFSPEIIVNENIKTELVKDSTVACLIPPRPANSHKGTTGKVAVVGGSRNTLGAAVMAGKSSLKSSAGYVRLYIPASMEIPAKTLAPELVTIGLEDENGYFVKDSFEEFRNQLQDSTAVVLGPGIGTKPGTVEFVKKIIETIDLPMIIDADGLNILARFDLENAQRNWVLTPHPGEAARLLNVDVQKIINDPLNTLNQLVRKYNCTVLLKGATTLIGEPGGNTRIDISGNPVLSVMGTGDVLSGITGSLLARGVEPFAAAWGGSYIHGITGDMAAEQWVGEGLLPTELIDFIPFAMEKIRCGENEDRITYIR